MIPSKKLKSSAYIIIPILAILIIIFAYQLNDNSERVEDQQPNYMAILETNDGNITIDLFENNAPQAVNRFINLSNNGFYNGTIIHRVFPDLAIYGGQYTINGTIKEYNEDSIPVETNPEIKHIPGTISYLRTSTDSMSVGCQFLICVDNISSLDGKNSAFGIVTEGLDLIKTFSNYPNDEQYNDGSGRLLSPWDVIIEKITIIAD
jgi:cyclophilin family peptidyl-prolyl cis-trans isomerase